MGLREEITTMQRAFGRIGSGERSRTSRTRRPVEIVEGLERRELLTGGSVAGAGSFVLVTPASTGPNTTVVSYQQHSGTTMLDVNLNGIDQYFSASQVTSLYYLGNSASGSQTFQDSTRLTVTALGGSGSNVFQGGSGNDTFIGGSGSNTFNAGTGFDMMEGGSGSNVFDENASGSGVIEENGTSDTINVPAGRAGNYVILQG
jgi:Ca2+-binding RTX toxin-like protein